MVTDNPTEIKYYYVRSFKWNNPFDHEDFEGNPKKGKVYRGWLNANTETYRIVYKNNTAMALQTINGSTERYKADLVEISLDTILDLDLKEKDLDIIDKWMESGNTDLLPKETPILDIPALIAKVNAEKDELSILLDSAHEELEELAEMDTLMFFQVAKILSWMLDEIHTIRTGPMDYDWLNLDKENGLGANVGSALKEIYEYSGPKKNEETIISAIHHLFVELKRREYNNLK